LGDKIIARDKNYANDGFVEVVKQKDGRMCVFRMKQPNILSPYILTNTSNGLEGLEVIKAFDVDYNRRNGWSRLYICTALPIRAKFAETCYQFATQSNNAHYKLAALVAMEQYFIAAFEAGSIPSDRAERAYQRYEAIASRIWRGSTPAEQANAFNHAFRMLARELQFTPTTPNGKAAK
jgi:hypothetical protein